MSFHNCACEIKSQPGSFGLLHSFCRTIKTIEDMRQIPRFNAWTLVTYTNNYLLRPCCATDLNCAFGCVFEGVGNEIGDNLFNPRFICQNDGEFFRKIRFNVVVPGLLCESFSNSVRQVRKRYICAAQAETTRLQTRCIQQIIDHLAQAVSLLFDDGK